MDVTGASNGNRRFSQMTHARLNSAVVAYPSSASDSSLITVKEVDRSRAAKCAKRSVANSIRKTLTRLGRILEVAWEYELVDRNAARVGGRRRRVLAVKPAQTYLGRAEHIVALLDAAREPEAEARSHRKWGRLAFLSVLTVAGYGSARPWRSVCGTWTSPLVDCEWWMRSLLRASATWSCWRWCGKTSPHTRQRSPTRQPTH